MDSKPNVLIITTDQQRTDSLSCYGSAAVDTPHLDKLGAEGAVFRRAYCANPVCTPARASIFSGQYVSRHGAWNVGLKVPEDVPMLSHHLAALSYRTHYIGKAHFQPFGGGELSIESASDWEDSYGNWRGPYYGFETVELSMGHTTSGLLGHYGLWLRSQVSAAEMEMYSQAARVGEGGRFGAEAYDWELPVRLHNSVWTANRAIDFFEHHDQSTPFFLAIGFQDPHHPHAVPTDFADRIGSDSVSMPRFSEGELDDKPPHFLAARNGTLKDSRFLGDYPMAGQGTGLDFTAVSEEDARGGRAYYYSMVKLIDREVGRILDCLDRKGLAENTLVIFLTDHGELLGDHGLWLKGPFHYEELVRIPFILRWPQRVAGGQSVDGLVSQVDIVPSVLAALQTTIPREVEGVDFMPLLTSDAESVRDDLIIECIDDPKCLRLKTVVTENRKLTYYHGEEFGELYDLDKDPGEIRNCWDDPAYRRDKMRLISRIIDHAERLERRADRISYA